jgi:hypothetical protein
MRQHVTILGILFIVLLSSETAALFRGVPPPSRLP